MRTIPATACAAPMFMSCALRPVSLWVFWLRTSILVARPAAIRQNWLYGPRLPGAPVLAKITAAAISIKSWRLGLLHQLQNWAVGAA